MQAAIDRVFRNFSLKPPTLCADRAQRETTREQAEAVAQHLLQNFKMQLANGANQSH